MESSSGINPQPKTICRAIEMSSIGKRLSQGSMIHDLEDCGGDIIDIIMNFVGIHAYVSVASVSTRWRHAWEERPKLTSPKWAVQSCSCLNWARACGLGINNKPCFLAAAEGRLDVLQCAVALGYSREGMAICERAAEGGHLEVVKWCHANGYPWGLSKLLAAEGGHLEVLQWCIASRAPDVGRRLKYLDWCRAPSSNLLDHDRSNTDVLNAAVEGGHLETVKWCTQHGFQWDMDTCYLAAKGGHLELLRWLRDKGCPWSFFTMIGAAEADDLKMLEWCRDNGCPWNPNALSAAARKGNLEIVKWCVANEPPGRRLHWSCLDAAEHGHLEVVQWLRGVGCRWGNRLCYHVASKGHFEVLKWCIANGCQWCSVHGHETAFEFHGTVPMMVWATANGCPWITGPSSANSLCWHAARGGNLEVLKWCATYHRMMRSRALEGVAWNGHARVLEWLRANTGVLEGYTNNGLCTDAAQSGSLEAVKWCRANGYPWTEGTSVAALKCGNLELLQWCRANGYPWSDRTCAAVIRRGNFEILAWCRDNGCPSIPTWRETSLMYGYAEMIEWCWECCPSNRNWRPIGLF